VQWIECDAISSIMTIKEVEMRTGKWLLSAALLTAVIGLQAAPPAQPAPLVSVEKVESISN